MSNNHPFPPRKKNRPTSPSRREGSGPFELLVEKYSKVSNSLSFDCTGQCRWMCFPWTNRKLLSPPKIPRSKNNSVTLSLFLHHLHASTHTPHPQKEQKHKLTSLFLSHVVFRSSKTDLSHSSSNGSEHAQRHLQSPPLSTLVDSSTQ